MAVVVVVVVVLVPAGPGSDGWAAVCSVRQAWVSAQGREREREEEEEAEEGNHVAASLAGFLGGGARFFALGERGVEEEYDRFQVVVKGLGIWTAWRKDEKERECVDVLLLPKKIQWGVTQMSLHTKRKPPAHSPPQNKHNRPSHALRPHPNRHSPLIPIIERTNKREARAYRDTHPTQPENIAKDPPPRARETHVTPPPARRDRTQGRASSPCLSLQPESERARAFMHVPAAPFVASTPSLLRQHDLLHRAAAALPRRAAPVLGSFR